MNRIRINQGCDHSIVFSVYNDSVSSSDIKNLSGHTAQLKVSDASRAVVFSVTGAVDPNLGQIEFNILKTVTAPLRFDGDTWELVYQVDLNQPEGTKIRLDDGELFLFKSIS